MKGDDTRRSARSFPSRHARSESSDGRRRTEHVPQNPVEDRNADQRHGDGCLRRCTSCGCNVPASGWEQHVIGIRHRRNQASINLLGEPGHLVHSIFEANPWHLPEVSNDPVVQRLRELMPIEPAFHNDGGQLPQPTAAGHARQRTQYLSRVHRNPSNQNPARPRAPLVDPPPTSPIAPDTREDQHQQRLPGRPHRRPHSEAYAQLQARRERRLMELAVEQGILPTTSSSSEADELSCDDTAQVGITSLPQRTCVGLPWDRRRALEGPCDLRPALKFPASAVVWCPGGEQLAALAAAARREAVHHTGLGPLYHDCLRLLGEEVLWRVVNNLRDRLQSYQRRLNAWLQPRSTDAGAACCEQQQQQAILCDARESDNGSDVTQLSRPRQRRPYIRLSPAELLLMSIHPSVVGSSSSCSNNNDTDAVENHEAKTPPAESNGFTEGPSGPRGRCEAADVASSSQPTSYSIRTGRGGGEKGRWRGCGRRLPVSLPSPPLSTSAADVSGRRSEQQEEVALQLPYLFLQVPFRTYGREAAAYVTALGLLLAALRRAAARKGEWLQAFGLRFSREDCVEVVAQGGSSRLAPLESLWKLGTTLGPLMQARPGWPRQLRLSCPAGLLGVEQLEALQRAVTDPQVGNKRKLAVLMGTHSRLGAASPILSLPREVLELVLDAALPRVPCRLVLGLSGWMPGQGRVGVGRRRSGLEDLVEVMARGAVAGGMAAAAGAGAAPGVAAPAGGAAALLEQLPLDVRVAAGHAARR